MFQNAFRCRFEQERLKLWKKHFRTRFWPISLNFLKFFQNLFQISIKDSIFEGLEFRWRATTLTSAISEDSFLVSNFKRSN
jgi:hypothetical protein